MRKPLTAGNWKMNGDRASVTSLIEGILGSVEAVPEANGIAVCPAFVHLDLVGGLVAGSRVKLGAQNVADQDAGAFTGEVSAPMLQEIGCDYVIVGHSERRHIYGESDALVAARFERAQAGGMVPILCVGELLEEREAGNTKVVVKRQLDVVINNSGIEALGRAVVAYEPVWAIGTGKTASPDQAQEVHAYIRAQLASRDQGVAEGLQILYGGSVKGANAAGLFSMEDIDGGLIGGASLSAPEFIEICAAG